MDVDASGTSTYISEWMSLTGGEHYEMLGIMATQWNDAHFTVSVEYKKDGESYMEHGRAMRQLQYLELS